MSEEEGKLPKARKAFLDACYENKLIDLYLEFMSSKKEGQYEWINASDGIFQAIAEAYDYKIIIIEERKDSYTKYEIHPTGAETKYIIFVNNNHYMKLSPIAQGIL